MSSRTVAAVFVAIAVAACSSSAESTTTTAAAASATSVSVTTSLTTGTTAAPGTTAAGEGEGSGPATTVREPVAITYEVRHREPAGEGDRLVVLVPAGDYSEIDLSNLVLDVIEANEPVSEVDVVDAQNALRAVIRDRENLTPRQERHYLLRLQNGNEIVFLGPYSELGTITLGS